MFSITNNWNSAFSNSRKYGLCLWRSSCILSRVYSRISGLYTVITVYPALMINVYPAFRISGYPAFMITVYPTWHPACHNRCAYPLPVSGRISDTKKAGLTGQPDLRCIPNCDIYSHTCHMGSTYPTSYKMLYVFWSAKWGGGGGGIQ